MRVVKVITAEDIRRALESRLRRKVDNVVWSYLIDHGYIGDVLEGEPIDELESAVRSLEEVRDAPKTTRAPRAELDPDVRGMALSQILAHEAGRLGEVASWRREVLRGRSIKRSSIESWILRREKQDEEPTVWVTRPRSGRGPSKTAVETLSYPDEVGGVATVAVAYGGTLWRLRQVALNLTARYPWEPVQAVGFLLTGIAPMVSKARMTIESPRAYEAGGAPSEDVAPLYPATQWVSLRLGPFLKPTEVAEIYTEARAKIFGTGRNRVIQPKHARLAVFAARHNDGRTWDEVMAEWNDQDPRVAYSEVRNFTRDARAAFERITGSKLRWRGKK